MTQTTSEMNVDIRSILYCLEEMKEQLRIESEKRETMEGRISALENDLKTEKERTLALEIHAHKECEEKEFMEGRITALENELSAFEIRIVAHLQSLKNELKPEKERTRALEIRVHMECEEKKSIDERISALENELKNKKEKPQALETGKTTEQRLSLLENWTGEKIKEEEQNDAVLVGYTARYNQNAPRYNQGVVQYYMMSPIYANKHMSQEDLLMLLMRDNISDVIINIESLYKLPNVRNIDIYYFIHNMAHINNTSGTRAIIVKHNGQVVLNSRELNYSPDHVMARLGPIHLFKMSTIYFKFKKQILDLLVVYPDLFTTNLEHCELFKTLHIIT